MMCFTYNIQAFKQAMPNDDGMQQFCQLASCGLQESDPC
jgi:hypothetical protein